MEEKERNEFILKHLTMTPEHKEIEIRSLIKGAEHIREMEEAWKRAESEAMLFGQAFGL